MNDDTESNRNELNKSQNTQQYSLTLFDALSVPIIILDKETNIKYCNDAACTLFPILKTQKERSLLFTKLFPGHDALIKDLFVRISHDLGKNKSETFTLSDKNKSQFKCNGQKLFNLDLYLLEIHPKNDILFSDTSRIFFDHAPIGILFFDNNGNIVELNKIFARIIGINKKTLLNFNIFKSLKDKKIKEMLKQVVTKGVSQYMEKDYMSTLTGKQTPLRGAFSPVKEKDGSIIGGLGFIEDLSEEKKAIREAYLFKNTQQSFLDGLPFMAWMKDTNGKFVSVNSQFCIQMGLEKDDIIEKKDSDLIYDHKLSKKYESEDLEVLTTGIHKQFEDHLIDTEGNDRWFESFKIPLFDSTKNIIGLAGYSMEISDRKHNERFINTIINSLPNPVLVKNEKFEWIYVNNAFCNYFNVSAENFVGKTNDQVFAPSRVKYLLETELEVFNNGKTIEYEDSFPSSSGETLEYIIRKSLLINAKGERMLIGVITDITDRNKNIAALERNEQQLRNITDCIPGKVFQMELFHDNYPKFHFVSKGAYDIYELQPEQIIENAGLITSQIDPLDKISMISNSNETLKNLTNWEQEYRIQTPSGKIKWIRATAVPFKNKDGINIWTGVSIDITEKKLVEQELKKRTELLEIATKELNNLLTNNDFESAILSFLSSLGKKLITNRAYIFKNDNTEITETTSLIYEWVSELHYKQLQSFELTKIPFSINACAWFYRKLKNGQVIQGTIDDFPSDEQPELIRQNIKSMILVPIFNKTGFWGFLGFDDCKESRIFTEAETYVLQATAASLGAFFDRKEYETELSTAKIKAEESEKLKTNFLANMSHELRTPLNGILGFANILRSELNSPDHIDIIDTIELSGNRLLETLNLILDLSTLESNQLTIKYQPFSITNIIQECAEVYTSRAASKGIIFQTHTARHYHLLSDEKILKTVIKKLLDNALKYTKSGIIKLDVSHETTESINYLLIKVSDTGIGIKPEYHATIFEPFRQVSEGYTREYEGSGLGLSLAKKYINLLKGDIDLKSEPERGSEFTIKIPGVIHDDQNASNENLTQTHITQEISKLNILVVEDDFTNRKYLEMILKKRYNVSVADNGALAFLLAKNSKFDIILMDINLGREMNGVETTELIRTLEGYKDIPIAAVTANAMSGQREHLLNSGFTHYISKPFKKDDLLNLILNMISNS